MLCWFVYIFKYVCAWPKCDTLQGFSHLHSHCSDAPFLSISLLWVALSDRRNCYSQTVIMWCELWLPPDSPVTIQWHRAKVSGGVRKPHDGEDGLTRRRGGGEGKREGGRSLGAVYRDVVPPIVLSVWLSLMVRLFASPMPLMSLHQSWSQIFDPQFNAALDKICMLIARLPNSCLKIANNVAPGKNVSPL